MTKSPNDAFLGMYPRHQTTHICTVSILSRFRTWHASYWKVV